MHPAYSVILFTTASGLGYGLLALAALFSVMGWIDIERWPAAAIWLIALGLISTGLLSSTFHLGRPERAWRAFSQWRSSWLSREGVLAVFTFIPALGLAAGWLLVGQLSGVWVLAAWATILGAIATVYCTGMIYASLKAIPRWNTSWVPTNYLLLAVATGAVWFHALLAGFGISHRGIIVFAVIALAAAWIGKILYWRAIDGAPATSTAGSATGLGDLGTVRMLDPPNTSANYLQKEMGYQVARKHARKLRQITHVTLFVVPAILLLLGLAVGEIHALVHAVVAGILVALGVVIERWLFFAEAEHTVMLYYGQSRV